MFHTFPDGRKEPITDRCTLAVLFMDGAKRDYPDTVYLALHPSLGYADPIVVDGTTVTIENSEQTFTLLGVRSFTMEFPI